jgi:hypothetical protein
LAQQSANSNSSTLIFDEGNTMFALQATRPASPGTDRLDFYVPGPTGAMSLRYNGDLDLNYNLNVAGTENITQSLNVTQSVVVTSGTTASFFVGNGAQITNFVIVASSESSSSKSVASTTDVTITTLTVTTRGGRPALVTATVQVNNGAAAVREYTYKLQQDGVTISNAYINDAPIALAGSLTINFQAFIASTSAGSHDYQLKVNSNSAAGTQTVTNRIVTLVEY